MDHAIRKKSRQGIRLLLGLIALCVFVYLVEIFVMGVPDPRKHSYKQYFHDKDLAPFWTQFALFAAVGATAAYFSINWKKGLPLVEAIDERDRKRLEARGTDYAQGADRNRRIQAVAFIVAGIIIVGLLASLLV